MGDKHDDLSDRMDELEQTISRLEQQIISIEQHLNIEEKKQAHPYAQIDQDMKRVLAQKQSTIYHAQKTKQPAKQPEKTRDKIPLTKPAQPEKTTPSLEKLLGVWLPRIFMFVLILGVLWGLKIGMDYGWISYGVRIGLGYLATLVLLYVGWKQLFKARKAYGLTLIGGVIAIGILVTMAAYYLYDLINYPVALIISMLYIAIGLFISKRTHSETLTIFSALAGFLLPYLIEGGTVMTWTFCAYILLLFLTLFYLAVSGNHKVSYYLTFLFFQASLFTYTVLVLPAGDEMFIVVTAFIQHLVLILVYLRNFIPVTFSNESLIYFNVALMIGWIKLLDPEIEPFVYGGLALLYIVITLNSYIKKEIKVQGIFSAIAIFALSALILSFNLDHFESKLSLLLVDGAIGIWVGLYYKSLRTLFISNIIYFFTGFVVLVLIPIEKWLSVQQIVWVTFILTITFIFYSLYKYATQNFKMTVKRIDILLVIGQLIGLIYILHLTRLTLPLMNDWTFENHIFLMVMLIAIFISFLTYRWRHGLYIAYAAMIEYLFLGLIFILSEVSIDITSVSNFYFNLTIEIIYLALLTGLFMRIIKDKLPGHLKLNTYASQFAVVVQVIYFFLLTRWYFSIADFYLWDNEYIYIVHTLWMFLFAFLSVSLGSHNNWKAVRYIGITLIAICLIKLFFFDLIAISLAIRAILFITVGVIGLIYSRTLQKSSS